MVLLMASIIRQLITNKEIDTKGRHQSGKEENRKIKKMTSKSSARKIENIHFLPIDFHLLEIFLSENVCFRPKVFLCLCSGPLKKKMLVVDKSAARAIN